MASSQETAYWWGNGIGSGKANCDGCGSRWENKQTAPVGSFGANPWGLYDTVGNVYEWSCSAYEGEYKGQEAQCAGKNDASNRVLRGGSWYRKPWGVRAAGRHGSARDYRDYTVGFRLARTL